MKNKNASMRTPVGVLVALSIANLLLSAASAAAQELVLGEEVIGPGVVMIFEDAVRDEVQPFTAHLAEALTDVHIEARANWHQDDTQIPEGSPPGGFVGYLHVRAQITNEATGEDTFVTLVPHINLIDNLHYARNVALPGEPSDLYTVRFFVNPPDPSNSRFNETGRNYGRTKKNNRQTKIKRWTKLTQ